MAEKATTLETKGTPWWLVLVGGILNMTIGFLLLTVPVKTAFSLIFVLGFYWIFAGIITLVGLFVDHSAWGWKLFIGVLSIFAGMTVLRYPLISTFVVPDIIVLLLGIQGVVFGIISIVMAFKGGGWGPGILGFLSLIFGGILIANYATPGMGLALAWVAAIFLIVGGIAQLFQAFRLRKA